MANYCIKWRRIFKGLSQYGGADISTKKNAAPLSLIKIYRMSLILAGSISLDNTFKNHLTSKKINYLLGVRTAGWAVGWGVGWAAGSAAGWAVCCTPGWAAGYTAVGLAVGLSVGWAAGCAAGWAVCCTPG
jgi:hypothetical protein